MFATVNAKEKANVCLYIWCSSCPFTRCSLVSVEQTPSITKGEEVVILYGEETTTIEGISWESEKDMAVLELRSDEHGSYMWGTYTDKKKDENPVKSFKVGKDGEKLLNLSLPSLRFVH